MQVLEEYSYTLPRDLLATTPASPRDAARLFIYDTATDTVAFTTFRELCAHVPPALFVYNDTKVVPARLEARHGDGTAMELFILADQGVDATGKVRGLVNRPVKVGDTIEVRGHHFLVEDNRQKWMLLKPQFPLTDLVSLLYAEGTTPIPPYITASNLSEERLRSEYQTIFAAHEASVAAPTAALHFTSELVSRLEAEGSQFTPVTLHVGLGTFAPVVPEQLQSARLHEERYAVGEETVATINAARACGRPIVAIGTTVVRTLESAKESILGGQAAAGVTELFIRPPYQFSLPDALITNFHVPRSSLMCMVDAFLVHKRAKRGILELYEIAIAERFRFYSFGDGMLIL